MSGWGDTKFDFLGEVYGTMQQTIDPTLEGLVDDVQMSTDPIGIPYHVTLFQAENWAFAFADYPYSGDPMVLENLSDVDSMALKMAVDEFKMGGVPLVYLEQYLVDVSNFVGYQTMPVVLWVQLKLVRSPNNSRRRSRLTNRKPFEFSATLQSIKSTPFFAKEFQEFAWIWRREHNGGNWWPTPRQVLVGLSEFYKLQLEKELRGCKQARLAVVQETYRRVFETIQRLINFPDLDKKFDRFDEEYSLERPESKACFIVLWLYSIEPPLYYFFNEACRLRNKAVVSLLGPFAAAVG